MNNEQKNTNIFAGTNVEEMWEFFVRERNNYFEAKQKAKIFYKAYHENIIAAYERNLPWVLHYDFLKHLILPIGSKLNKEQKVRWKEFCDTCFKGCDIGTDKVKFVSVGTLGYTITGLIITFEIGNSTFQVSIPQPQNMSSEIKNLFRIPILMGCNVLNKDKSSDFMKVFDLVKEDGVSGVDWKELFVAIADYVKGKNNGSRK